MDITLNGNATVKEVNRLHQDIILQGKQNEKECRNKKGGHTLRLSRCRGMTPEVYTAVIDLLKSTPKREKWKALIVEDCCMWTQLEPLMETIHKLDIFESISYCSSSVCLCGGERIYIDEQRRISYRAPYILSAFTRFPPHSCCLKELKLSGKEFSDRCAITLRLALHSTTSLTTLKLRFREYEKGALPRVLLGIEANKSIKTLDMSQNRLGSTADLIKSVVAHPTIESLDLSGNHVGAPGLLALAEALAVQKCKISELKMSQCDLVDIAPFFTGLHSNYSLKTLILSENRNLVSVTDILENIFKFRGLEKLSISRCLFRRRPSPEDTASLLSYCSRCCTTNNGSDNDDDDDDTPPQNHNLRSLALSMNNFGDTGLDTLLCFCAIQFPALESLALVQTSFSHLKFPNFLSLDFAEWNINKTLPVAASSASSSLVLPNLRKLNFGTLEGSMVGEVSKIVDKLPGVYSVGATFRVDHLDEWRRIQSKLDQRRFPVTDGDSIRPLSLWPIIFGNVNRYFSSDRNKDTSCRRRAEFLHEFVQGPAMPLLHIAMEGGATTK